MALLWATSWMKFVLIHLLKRWLNVDSVLCLSVGLNDALVNYKSKYYKQFYQSRLLGMSLNLSLVSQKNAISGEAASSSYGTFHTTVLQYDKYGSLSGLLKASGSNQLSHTPHASLYTTSWKRVSLTFIEREASSRSNCSNTLMDERSYVKATTFLQQWPPQAPATVLLRLAQSRVTTTLCLCRYWLKKSLTTETSSFGQWRLCREEEVNGKNTLAYH